MHVQAFYYKKKTVKNLNSKMAAVYLFKSSKWTPFNFVLFFKIFFLLKVNYKNRKKVKKKDNNEYFMNLLTITEPFASEFYFIIFYFIFTFIQNNVTNSILESPCMGGRKGRDGVFPATSCIKIAGYFGKVN